MKGVFRAGCVVLVLSALTFVGRSWSEAPKAPPAPRTKVGMVNLAVVLKNYKKFTVYQEEMKTALQAFQKRDKEFKREIEDLAREFKEPGQSAEMREEIEAKLKKLTQKMEDNSSSARKLVEKKQEKQMLTLYKDIQQTVEH